jgi:hypothetical protein
MPGFLYFLPAAKTSDIPANLKRWGLSYLLDGEGSIHPGRQASVAGVHGLVIGCKANWSIEEVKAGDHIEWAKFPKPFAEIPPMLGWVKDQPMPGPGPDDLARVKQISGELHTLADGNRWLLPIAKQYTGQSNLPMSFGLDEETGDWITDTVVKEYREIWRHANQYLAAMTEAFETHVEGEPFKWVIPDGNALVSDSFQANYRVCEMELAKLGLLVSGIHQLVADTLIDSNGWNQLKKKEAKDIGAG